MTRVGRTAAALVVFGCIVGAARTASAASLDPFRTGARVDRGLDPFRVAQALPATPPAEPKKATPTPAAPAAAPAPASNAPTSTPAQPQAKACQKDDDCPDGNICKSNVCQKIELSTNLFPLYYHEGNFTEILLFYWSRSGTPGYTVVAPFYWHFYSASRASRRSTGTSRTDERADGHLPVLVEPRAGRALVRDLAAVLRVEQVRLGGPAAADVQRRRLEDRRPVRRLPGPLLVEAVAEGRDRPRARAALRVVARRRARVHLGRAAELLLAQRRRREPAGAAALLPEQAQQRVTRSTPGSATAAARTASPAGRRSGCTGTAATTRATTRYDVLFPLLWSFRGADVADDRLLPAGLELQRTQDEHDRRGPLHPPPQRHLVLQHRVPALVERRRRRHRAAASRLFIPFFFWQHAIRRRAPRRW